MSIQNALRYVIYGALFIIPFIPLYVANSLFFPFITGKGFAFRILVEIAFFAWMLLALANREYRPRFSWVMVAYTAFVAWMFIADSFAVNPHKAFWSNFERMDGWVTMIHVFAFFLVSGAVLSADKLWRKWWMTFLGASALVSAYCLLQLGGAIDIHQGGARVDGTLGNAAYLAAYLLFTIAVSVWYALESRGGVKVALYALAGLQVFLVFETATRGAVLGLIGGALVATFLWMLEAGEKTRKVAGGILAGIVLVSGGVYLVRESAFIQHNPTLSRVTSISVSDLSVRSTLWGMAWQGALERPVTGWGQEGFNYVFNKYYQPSLYAQEPWFDRAHDVFIDWLVAGGFPALLLFLALFATTAFELYRREATRPERILVLAALTAYAIQAVVVFDNIMTYIPLAAIFATAHATSSRRMEKVEAVAPMTEETLQVATPLVAVVAVALVWMVNVPNMNAATELVHGLSFRSSDISSNLELLKTALNENTFATQEVREQTVIALGSIISSQQTVSQALADFVQFAMQEMGAEVERQPLDARLRLEYALGFRSIGDYKSALTQVGEAKKLAPKKQQIYIEEGIEKWQLGDYAGARDAFNQAYDLDHSFAQVATYAAAGDIMAGDPVAGKALLLQSVGTTTVNNDALIIAYFKAKDYENLIGSIRLQVEAEERSAASMLRLASAYASAGRFTEARATLTEMVQEHPEAADQAQQLSAHFPR